MFRILIAAVTIAALSGGLISARGLTLGSAATPTPAADFTPQPTPTPTATPDLAPTPTPTATATPVPAPAGLIVVRFTHDGQPMIYDGEFLGFWASGTFCEHHHTSIVPGAPLLIIGFDTVPEGPPVCGAAGAALRLCFDQGGCVETLWQGGSTVLLDLEVPRDPARPVVTARFVKNGAPVAGDISYWSFTVGSSRCAAAVYSQTAQFQRPASTVPIFWPPMIPWRSDPACGVIGAKVEVTIGSDSLGSGTGSFTVTGQDSAFDVVFGEMSLPPVTFEGTGLPRGGGAPPVAAHGTASLIAAGAVIAGAGLAMIRLGSRP